MKKALGELTGREFHWGLVAQIGGGLIGDIFSANAAKSAQQTAEANQLALQQQATQQQEQYIAQQQQQQREIINSVATQGNPFDKAAEQSKAALPGPAPIPSTPTSGGQQYGGGSATPTQGVLAPPSAPAGAPAVTPPAPSPALGGAPPAPQILTLPAALPGSGPAPQQNMLPQGVLMPHTAPGVRPANGVA